MVSSGVLSIISKCSGWVARLAALSAAAAFAVFAGWPVAAPAQVANFHPCNSQPSLPICLHGYGRRIAVQRWGALPEPLDPDAGAKASLVTSNPAAEMSKLKSSAVIVQARPPRAGPRGG